jgi:hypothetical protein
MNNIDWHCEVKTLFHETNKGCRNAPPTAISWMFEHVEKGIIIEDDCILELSFFNFAEELLNFYASDDKVMHISAVSTFSKISNNSFDFSNYPLSWGWATWRRAWDKYDVSIAEWKIDKENKDLFFQNKHKKVITYFEKRFDAVFNYMPSNDPSGGSNTWDYQWYYCLLKHDGLSIVPQKNMVSNIGFDETATHTKDSDTKSNGRSTHAMNFPLLFPKNRSTSKANDIIEKELFNINKSSELYILLSKTKKRLLNKFKLPYKTLCLVTAVLDDAIFCEWSISSNYLFILS